MEKYDPEMAARVWQRVRPGQMNDDPIPLISTVQRNARRYGLLARQLGGGAQKLADAKQAQADCLRGLWMLQSGEVAQEQFGKTESASVRISLCRCLAEELALLREFEQRTEQPRFGPVYLELAREQRIHCAMAARLLGRISRRDDSLPQR